MLLGVFCADTDRPPTGFCNEPLLGGKYECDMPVATGLLRTAQEQKLHPYLTSNTSINPSKNHKPTPYKNPHEIYQFTKKITILRKAIFLKTLFVSQSFKSQEKGQISLDYSQYKESKVI